MHTLWQDVRYGTRTLIKKPVFTSIAVITLALGIGANTAIFSVVNAVLLRPLPYPDSAKLMHVGEKFPSGLWAAGEPQFLFWREHSQSFEVMTEFKASDAGGNLAGGDEAEYVSGLKVSVDFFRVFRVAPALGRPFTAEEDVRGAEPVVVLSDGLWRRRFGADPGVVGRQILFNGRAVTVIGVMPRQFPFIPAADVFSPLQPSVEGDPNPNEMVVGRLRPGVSEAQARAEIAQIAEQCRVAHPDLMQKNESAGVEPYKELFSADSRQLLWILLGAVGFLLLISCANVANLQLTRSTARRKELAVRMALGASGWRVSRQLLTEGVVLSLIGGALGLLLAIWGTDLLVAALPSGFLSRAKEVSFDWRVLGFTFVIAVGSGLLFALAPAIQARRVDVNTALKEAGKGLAGAARGKLRAALVVLEVAMSLVLLIGAMLLVRTFAKLQAVEPGFDPHNVLTCRIALNGERYNSTRKAADFYRAALERIAAMPGVEAAAVTNTLPLNAQFNMPIIFPSEPDQMRSVQFRMITPDYFRVMKIELKQGRIFNASDAAGSAPVAMVNEAFVQKYLAGSDPASQQFSVGKDLDDPQRQIVGVVSDQKQYSLDSAAPPTVYLPLAQVPDKLMAVARKYVTAFFTVRTTVEPLSMSDAIKREVAALDPALPPSEFRSMELVVSESVAPQRLNMILVALFATLGMILAAIGIYGVMSYSVAQRTGEIGIRVALGARGRDVFRLMLRHGLKLVALGIVSGLLGAVALTRVMESMLFGVTATDPLTFGVVSVVLALVAMLASYVPSRRASKVDPIVALRYE